MEYYIYVTKSCNYNCKYCDVVAKAKQSPAGMRLPTVSKTIDYIRADKTCADTEKILAFYGGEPLMNSAFIQECIKHTENTGMKYLLCTNGSLLDKAEPTLLEKIHYFFISIDGDRDIHDRYRGGPGSFDLIMRNVLELKRRANGTTLARITLPIASDASLYKAVIGVIDSFDYVYCQVENNEIACSTALLDGFKKRFGEDLDKLIKYWVAEMEKGIVRNIVPFQAIISSLMFNRISNDLPRCGCGASIVYLDTDGHCYMCDKLLGKDEFSAGNYHDGPFWRYNSKCTELREHCIECEIRFICGGRCLPQLLYYPDDKFAFYCEIQKMAVRKLNDALSSIKELIARGVIERNNLDIEAHPIEKCTELVF
ncbi:MAG: radical SAM protein [Verrucomicrobiota bacterium]|jgi:putative peptide-modifying radical SAM enzyme